ncbi:MAG: hypothetical protein ACRD82_20580 [Blastocatellia bacterium]
MARRTIRTVDGQVFSDRTSRFENKKGCVLYRKSAFKSVRINNRSIVSDDTSGLSTPVMMALVIFMLMVLLISFLLLNRSMQQVGEAQSHSNLQAEPSLIVIASKKSGLYYLPECSEYLQVWTLAKKLIF